MKCFLLIILSCMVLSYALPIFPKKVTEEEMEFAEKYLNSGHPQLQPRSYSRPEDNDISTVLIGQKKKFCGVGLNNLIPNIPVEVPNIGAYSHFPGSPKWRKTKLTYSIQNYTPDMNRSEVDEAVRIACKVWSSVTPLSFTKVPRNGDLVISFYDKDHKTPFNVSVLAYAYAPGSGPGGDIYLNDEVYWTLDNYKTFLDIAINLLLAVIHEIGHALGLGHSDVPGSLMKEDYTPLDYKYGKFHDCRTIELHEDDRLGIQALYGPRPK